FGYDGLRRLRVRTEATWSGTGWVTNQVVRYIYDGYSVIQERDGNNTVTASYTRGLDLSQTMGGAGGIGGILARTAASGQSLYYHADGNGNITALVDGSAAVVAQYAYDPFGNLISQGGAQAANNNYRFSSKELHANSGLYYYGFRWYDPNLQRFIN